MGRADNPGCQLYLITPPAFEPAAFAETLKAALDAGPAACLQLRLKDAPDDAVRRAAEILMPVCHRHDIAFLVNDRPDLAREIGADGVHVGQEDAAYAEARALVGGEATVGVTCHNSLHLAMEAAEAGADYVAFGAFFPTRTKDPKSKADLETLESWSAATVVPCVAIGGITVENCRPLVRAGADFLAVVVGVWDHPEGPAAAVRAFAGILAARGAA
ncbi:MAG: thiamine phosphate synthase [Rhodospirillaceae bacterium]|nr:thiamine phosphate synthase [Rhodospirillaceae bacterium]MYF86606.1 thiamine phosphate synthase [Rhodospirillaceae bacterium]MYH36154.1 thiamine phosphate synthase [Rhodospirillaceae bacterium]MYK12702.1 thiamine phosphate synthase [Rhodospirillaceae bacterium]MYK57955.1 thiamine phosphate synthase [Rhodospirillaceae bacterium]